jgi:hypothetical protein
MILRINTIISLNSINQMIFVMEMHCVFTGVGTEFLNIIKMTFRPQRINIRFYVLVAEDVITVKSGIMVTVSA